MTEQRQHPRSPLNVDVRITHPHIGRLIRATRDLSDGGIFVQTEPDELPEVGEVVEVQVLDLGEDAPVVTMEIVRKTPDGAGLRFLNR